MKIWTQSTESWENWFILLERISFHNIASLSFITVVRIPKLFKTIAIASFLSKNRLVLGSQLRLENGCDVSLTSTSKILILISPSHDLEQIHCSYEKNCLPKRAFTAVFSYNSKEYEFLIVTHVRTLRKVEEILKKCE